MSSRGFGKSTVERERVALTRQLQFLGQMQSTETAHFHQLAAAKNGMNITDSKTVSVLLQEGPLTAGQLALRLSLTTGAVTNVIDRLVAAGVVRRVADPTDRRKVIVRVNPKKIARLGKTYESMGASFEKLLQTYSTEELAFLVAFYQAAIELTKQEIKKL